MITAHRYREVSRRFRARRFELFTALLAGVPTPLTILDVGGTPEFWIENGFGSDSSCKIVLLNTHSFGDLPNAFESIVGDAGDPGRFRDKEFEVAHSNSTLAYVGNWEDQRRAAQEIQRVGKRIFIQTPNRHFPIDWRTALPLFHFLPPAFQASLACRLKLGRWDRFKTMTPHWSSSGKPERLVSRN